ncbi:DUF4259 domain-containing protein [Plantactinospora sp. GCM10030261]|uniref:DUF4259 domain-containing protein n=1 Tax=Plantactinospora sp. GCM10030261 TaxID=3273420 RepID=UPI003621274A
MREATAVGFWDSSAFGNDDAADFAGALDETTAQGRIEMVGAVLERVAATGLAEDLDAGDAPRAVAAAALVAAQCPSGEPLCSTFGPSTSMPQFPGYLRQLAIVALDRLVTPPSWLADAWENDPAWRRTVNDLRNVLDPPQREALFDL